MRYSVNAVHLMLEYKKIIFFVDVY